MSVKIVKKPSYKFSEIHPIMIKDYNYRDVHHLAPKGVVII